MPVPIPRGVPVVQTPQRYDQAIGRHGQSVMWYTAMKCWCLTDFSRPDPSHAQCMGRGFVYNPVTQVRTVDSSIGQGVRTLTMNPTYKIASINRIYSVSGSWEVDSISNNVIVTDSVVEKGRIVTVDFMWDLTSAYAGVATVAGNGVLSVPIRTSNEQGVFYGQIVSIQTLHNVTQNRNLTSLGVWENNILVDPAHAATGDIITVSCTWTRPLKMVLSQIDPKTVQKNPQVLQEYHAQVTSPGSYHIAEGDLITPQVMRQRDSIVCIAKSGEVAHQLPYFHVERLTRIEWSGGVITDAQLVRNNTILWGAHKPTAGAKFAVQFLYHPTFRVGMDLPNLRYAEDKEFPQRMFLKRFDLFNRTGMALMNLGGGA